MVVSMIASMGVYLGVSMGMSMIESFSVSIRASIGVSMIASMGVSIHDCLHVYGTWYRHIFRFYRQEKQQ